MAGRDAGGGMAGMGGMGMAGTGGGPAAGNLCSATGDCTNVVGALDGFTIDGRCAGPQQGPDCEPAWCFGKPSRMQMQAFQLTGPAAAPGVYDVTIRVRGVQECKEYSGGQRRSANMELGQFDKAYDQWHIGGTAPNSSYNSIELHITPPVAGAMANDYFLNSCPRRNELESHFVWRTNYAATFQVNGGGTITYRQVDANCRQIQNCGVREARQPCETGQMPLVESVNMPPPTTNIEQPPSMIPGTAVAPVPAPPAWLTMQPLRSAANPPGYGQFMHIDVISVVKRP